MYILAITLYIWEVKLSLHLVTQEVNTDIAIWIFTVLLRVPQYNGTVAWCQA